MSVIDGYLKNKTKNISFLELKKDAGIEIGGQLIDSDIPLPILTEMLVEGIKRKTMYEEIKVSHIISGIIYILGVDPNFKFNDYYKKVLYLYDPKIENYIFYQGIKYLSEEKDEEALIYFRALLNINPKNADGLFNYGICLEKKADQLFELGNNDKGEAFLKEATNCFESVLDIKPDYFLAYYKLGYHYKNSGQFLKATLAWEKYLALDNDKFRNQEIREEINTIYYDSLFEKGYNLYCSGKYDDALDKLLKVESRYNELWNLKYIIGLSYKEIGEFEKAVEYFHDALELNSEFVDLYNELGICLFSMGSFSEALDVFTSGIEKDSDDYKLLFNRGIVYYKLGLIDKAILDIKRAHTLNPEDEMVSNFIENLGEEI